MHISTAKISLSLLGLSALAFAACSGTGTVPSAGSSVGTASSAVRSLKCVTQDGGTCSITPNGTVTLALPDPPAADAGAGVYFAADHSLDGVALESVKELAFTVTGPPDVNGSPTPAAYQAGSPRVSIPVTYNGAATTAYVYPVSCTTLNAGSGTVALPGTIDPINNAAPNVEHNYCLEMQGFSNPQYYGDWSTFVTTFGTAVIADPPLFLADADNASGGTWILADIKTKK